MRVRRTKDEIIDVGATLHNCIGYPDMLYMRNVEQEESVLVCLNDENGQPNAVGEHPLRGIWNEGGWNAIYETCNRSPSRDTHAAFQNYSEHFRKWHREIFVPERRK